MNGMFGLKTYLSRGQILGETLVFLADLEGQFTSVAHNQNRNFPVDWLQLLKSCQNENGRLSHSRFCLTNDVHAEDCLWDTFVLYLRWMLKTAIVDDTQKFGTKHQVTETTAVN